MVMDREKPHQGRSQTTSTRPPRRDHHTLASPRTHPGNGPQDKGKDRNGIAVRGRLVPARTAHRDACREILQTYMGRCARWLLRSEGHQDKTQKRPAHAKGNASHQPDA